MKFSFYLIGRYDVRCWVYDAHSRSIGFRSTVNFAKQSCLMTLWQERFGRDVYHLERFFFSALTSSLALRWISSFLIGFNGSLELPRRAKMLVPRAWFENPSSALIAPQNKVQSWEANSAYPLVRRKHVLYVAESASRLRELFPPNVTDEWCVVGATKLNIVE